MDDFRCTQFTDKKFSLEVFFRKIMELNKITLLILQTFHNLSKSQLFIKKSLY